MSTEIETALWLVALAIITWLTCKIFQWKWDRSIRKEENGIADRL